MTDHSRSFGIALVALAAICFGLGPILVKTVYAGGTGIWTLLVWRTAIAALLSGSWLVMQTGGRRAFRNLSGVQAVVLLGLGVVFAGSAAMYYGALQRVPASLAAVVMATYPVIVGVLSARMGYMEAGRRPWIALGLAVLGSMLVVGGIEVGADPVGVLLAALSSMIAALWIILTMRAAGERRGATARPPGGFATIQPHVASVVMLCGTTGAFLAVALAVGAPLKPQEIPPSAWPPVVALGALSGALGFQAFYAGASRIGAANAALVALLEPVSTLILAWLVLGEVLQPSQLLGAAMVISGVLVVQAPPGKAFVDARRTARVD